jgi:hypothetical protein
LTQTLPTTRAALLTLHAEARQRRDRSALGGPEYRQACEDIATIEVQIARIEQPAPATSAAPATPAAPKTGA